MISLEELLADINRGRTTKGFSDAKIWELFRKNNPEYQRARTLGKTDEWIVNKLGLNITPELQIPGPEPTPFFKPAPAVSTRIAPSPEPTIEEIKREAEPVPKFPLPFEIEPPPYTGREDIIPSEARPPTAPPEFKPAEAVTLRPETYEVPLEIRKKESSFGKGIAQGLSYGVYEIKPEEIEDNRYYQFGKGVGDFLSFVPFMFLGAGLPVKAAQAVAKPALARLMARMASGAATFGGHKLVTKGVEYIKKGKPLDWKFAEDLGLSIGLGMGLGGVRVFQEIPAQILGAMAVGAGYAKLQKLPPQDVVVMATVYGVFTALSAPAVLKADKMIAYRTSISAIRNKMVIGGKNPVEATKIAKGLVDAAIAKAGGWEKLTTKNFDNFSQNITKYLNIKFIPTAEIPTPERAIVPREPPRVVTPTGEPTYRPVEVAPGLTISDVSKQVLNAIGTEPTTVKSGKPFGLTDVALETTLTELQKEGLIERVGKLTYRRVQPTMFKVEKAVPEKMIPTREMRPEEESLFRQKKGQLWLDRKAELKRLGFADEAIERVKPEETETIIRERLTPKDVSILPSGELKVIKAPTPEEGIALSKPTEAYPYHIRNSPQRMFAFESFEAFQKYYKEQPGKVTLWGGLSETETQKVKAFTEEKPAPEIAEEAPPEKVVYDWSILPENIPQPKVIKDKLKALKTKEEKAMLLQALNKRVTETIEQDVKDMAKYLEKEYTEMLRDPATSLIPKLKEANIKIRPSQGQVQEWEDAVPPEIRAPQKYWVASPPTTYKYAIYAPDDLATQEGFESGDEFLAALRQDWHAEIYTPSFESEARANIAPEILEVSRVIEINLDRLGITPEVTPEITPRPMKLKFARPARPRRARPEKAPEYTEPEIKHIKKLRQTIHAWASVKGFSKAHLGDIIYTVTGHYRLTGEMISKKTGIPELQEILRKVKKARPKIIKAKRVITPKTESKIKSLVEHLKRQKVLSNEYYEFIKKDMGIKEPAYVDAKTFITERKGNEFIRRLITEAKLMETLQRSDNAIDRANKMETPEIANEIKKLYKMFEGEAEIKKASVSEWFDVSHYFSETTQRTAQPFLASFEKIRAKHAELNYRKVVEWGDIEKSTLKFPVLMRDKEALDRISDYIASKLKVKGAPEYPKNITPDEIKLAKALQEKWKTHELTVRTYKFLLYWWNNKDESYIAELQNPKLREGILKDLRQASETWETTADREKVKEFLKDKKWGVIKSGYEPHSILRQKIFTDLAQHWKDVSVSKSRIKVRMGVEYQRLEKRDILTRYRAYARQIYNLELEDEIRAMAQLFENNADKFENPDKTASIIGGWLNDIKGYYSEATGLTRLIRRILGQVMTAVFWNPYRWIRNWHQNAFFHPNFFTDFFNLRNKTLTPEDGKYFSVRVSQKMGLRQHYLLERERPFKGLTKITRFAQRTSQYPFTDETNRHVSFWARINRVRRALKRMPDIKAVMKESGIGDLEPAQRAFALEELTLKGQDAFARYVAHAITDNVHFLYESSLRPPATRGTVSRMIGSLLTFPHGFVQRLYLNFRRLNPKYKYGFRMRALKTLLMLIGVSAIKGAIFRKITGKKNPYAWWRIVMWKPGGLAIGAPATFADTIFSMLRATFDRDEASRKNAINQFSYNLTRSFALFIPFYEITLDVLESITDLQGVDQLAIKKMRHIIDKEYDAKGEGRGKHYIERSLLEALQHGIFGAFTPPKPSLIKQMLKLAEAGEFEGLHGLIDTAKEKGIPVSVTNFNKLRKFAALQRMGSTIKKLYVWQRTYIKTMEDDIDRALRGESVPKSRLKDIEEATKGMPQPYQGRIQNKLKVLKIRGVL